MTERFAWRATVLALAALLLAAAGPVPSALVQLGRLQKGSLPHIVTAYGSVQPDVASRQVIMAPLSATVAEVYVRPGETVAAHAPLLRLEPSPTVGAAFAQAQAAQRLAHELVDRTRRMVAQHLATAQQLAEAEKSAADAHAALTALHAQGAGGSNILRAPFDAIVTRLSVSPGTIVTEGATLLDLARPDGMILKVGVVPAQAVTVIAGNDVTISPIGASDVVAGKVLLRGSVVAATGLVPVEISLPPGKLLPGEMAMANITTGQVTGYVVPHVAILVNDHGTPYVVQSINMTARKVAVRILCADGDKDVIAGPLNAAAPLVLAGNYQLHDGMKMRLAAKGARPAR